MKTERYIIRIKHKRTVLTLVMTKEPHINPDIKRACFYISATDESGKVFDYRYDKEYDNEKQFRAALKRYQIREIER